MTVRSTWQPAPPDGELTAVDLDGAKIAVARVQDRRYAFQDACTQMELDT
jgi:hypothetical protein